MFKQITVIGGGLMGGSLAWAAQQNQLAGDIVIYDRAAAVRRVLRQQAWAGRIEDSLIQAVTGSDMVVLAVPIGEMQAVAENMAAGLEKGCLVIDMGSVKHPVIEAVRASLPSEVFFLPSHPLAGTEDSGPKAARADLLQGRICALTPLPTMPADMLHKGIAFWQGLGMRVMTIAVDEHDRVAAVSSHVPHVIAFALAECIKSKDPGLQKHIESLSGGGLKDFIRVAASDSIMWRDIFLANKDNILAALADFKASLASLEALIAEGQSDTLYDWLNAVRHWRRQEKKDMFL